MYNRTLALRKFPSVTRQVTTYPVSSSEAALSGNIRSIAGLLSGWVASGITANDGMRPYSTDERCQISR